MLSSRILVPLAATLLLTSPGPPASAVDEPTCRDLTATILGEAGGTVEGTDGDDVIVTNGAEDTHAGPGDDTICVTRTTRFEVADVDAGPGADVVDTTAVTTHTTAVLGTGADELWGGDGDHYVTAGESDGVDRETDLVHAGSGFDIVATGEAGQPDADNVDLGSGGGGITARSERPSGALRSDPGSGSTLRVPPLGPGRWVIDNRAGRATLDGATVISWENLSMSYIDLLPGAHLTYAGTNRDDFVYIHGGDIDGIDLRGGDDEVDLRPTGRITGTIDGGDGDNDTVEVFADHALVDLRGGDFSIRPGHLDAHITGFENVEVFGAEEATVRGDAGPNFVYVQACRARIRGGRGADEIYSAASRGTRGPCPAITRDDTDIKLFGGPGDDSLKGGPLAEYLFGGPGRDAADGDRGYDVCRAETERSCEA